MTTPDIKSLSVVIAARIDDPSRFTNLVTVINTYRRFFGEDVKLIVANDQGPKSLKRISLEGNEIDISAQLESVCDVYLQRDGEQLFCKWWCYNNGVLAADTPYVMCADSDIVVEPLAVLHALKQAVQYKVVMPYNGVALYCKPHVRVAFVRNGYNMQVLRHIVPETPTMGLTTEHLWVGHTESPGGAVVFDTETFKQFGGYNTHFRGWGYEDNEILKRFSRFGADPVRIMAKDAVLWHFHHDNAVKNTHPHYIANRKIANNSASKSVAYLRKQTPPLT